MAFSKCCPFASQLPLWPSAPSSLTLFQGCYTGCAVSPPSNPARPGPAFLNGRGEIQWLATPPPPLAFPSTSCSLGQGSGTSPFRTDFRMSGTFAKGEIWSSLCHVRLQVTNILHPHGHVVKCNLVSAVDRFFFQWNCVTQKNKASQMPGWSDLRLTSQSQIAFGYAEHLECN